MNIAEEINKAVQFHVEKKLDEAEVIYKKILSFQPDHADALHLLGVVYFQNGDHVEAQKLIGKAIEIDASKPNFHNNMGNALRLSGRCDHAAISYRKALALDPISADAQANLAVALRDLQQIDDAIEACKKAIKINPTLPQPYNTLGNLYSDQMEWGKAEEAYRRALEIQPFPEAFNNLGNVLKDLGKLDEAVFCYQNAVSLHPEYVEAFNNLGNVLKLLNQLGEAKEAYDRALDVNPGFAEAHFNLGILFKELGNLDEAKKEYAFAAELDPSNHSARHMLSAFAGESVEFAPLGYIEELFDRFAPTFEEELVNKLSYRTPDLLKNLVASDLVEGFKFHNVVDLGCGTGLSGMAIKEWSGCLTGIDASKKMLVLAERKKVYDNLIQGEIYEIISSSEETFDLFFAVDVFIYIGNLTLVFDAVRKQARKNALFAFSTESYSDDEDFILQVTGRFSHSMDYINRIAKETGFVVEKKQSANIRKDKGQWIVGDLFILKAV